MILTAQLARFQKKQCGGVCFVYMAFLSECRSSILEERNPQCYYFFAFLQLESMQQISSPLSVKLNSSLFSTNCTTSYFLAGKSS